MRLMERALWCLVAFVVCLEGGAYCSRVQARQLPTRLVQAPDMAYVCSFTLPDALDTVGNVGTSWANGQIAFHNSGGAGSLFFVGHDHGQQIAEFNIPPCGGVATTRQPFRDAIEGRIGQINPTDGNGKVIGGLWVSGAQLVVTVFSYYDGGGTAQSSHFVRSITLTAAGLQGPYRVGSGYAGAHAGFFVPVPNEWQAALGTTLLNGSGPHAIVSLWSNGPSIGIVNPADLLAARNPSPATRLLWYDSAHALGQYCGNTSVGQPATPPNPLFNGTTEVNGAVILADTRSILFMGRHGMGPCNYQPGGGPDAPPYEPHVWAYDLNDLLAVKAASQQPYQPRPYATFRLPIIKGDRISGVTTDPSTGRIFVSEKFGDGAKTRIHVFTISGSSQPPPPPPPSSDTIPPSVSLTASTLNVPPGQPVTFTATALDNIGVDRVDVINATVGESVLCTLSVPPYACTWPGTGPAGTGTRTFLARARDAAGNVGASAAVVVTVGTAPPPPPPPPVNPCVADPVRLSVGAWPVHISGRQTQMRYTVTTSASSWRLTEVSPALVEVTDARGCMATVTR